MSKDIVYLDNAAETFVHKDVITSWNQWAKKNFNKSSSTKFAQPTKEIFDVAYNYILKLLNVPEYKCIFTSGATESNSTAIRMVVSAYANIKKIKPHIICSATEHKSVIECIEDLLEKGEITVTWIKPTYTGIVLKDDIKRAITPDTCLAICMYANNETGVINSVQEIGAILHQHKIPLMSDCVQIFSKFRINMMSSYIDILTASFHKFHGPPGCGLLVINNELIEGYKIKRGIINGSQQFGLRGGTENIPAIAASLTAMKLTYDNRDIKNAHLLKLKEYLLDNLVKVYNYIPIIDILNKKFNIKNKNTACFTILGEDPTNMELTLPNILMISIINPIELHYIINDKFSPTNVNQTFCNVRLKKDLDDMKIVISISSACLTSSKKASHVLYSMNMPAVVRKGVIRISFSDYTKKDDIDKFISGLKICVSKQFTDKALIVKENE